jgi:hypothetical protein
MTYKITAVPEISGAQLGWLAIVVVCQEPSDSTTASAQKLQGLEHLVENMLFHRSVFNSANHQRCVQHCFMRTC